MKGFKGTKGEWLLQEEFRKPKIINESGQVMFEHFINCYDDEDELHKYYSHNKMMSNAKLIAAAPELLEALVDVTNELYNAIECLHGKETAEINDNIKKADLAISKALD